ncbi:unnamed protein product [Oikopleura dioica]|uniref:Secreted protein n=1 Tax=Oikopleura dioica TaxID=34765 RepID=E4YHM0_OIKDI|nr:unnamed protein product [Oikopleura dioica]
MVLMASILLPLFASAYYVPSFDGDEQILRRSKRNSSFYRERTCLSGTEDPRILTPSAACSSALTTPTTPAARYTTLNGRPGLRTPAMDKMMIFDKLTLFRTFLSRETTNFNAANFEDKNLCIFLCKR